jgi:hypothetical protein
MAFVLFSVFRLSVTKLPIPMRPYVDTIIKSPRCSDPKATLVHAVSQE